MRRFLKYLLIFSILIPAAHAQQYAAIQLKHFTNAPGTYMSAEFTNSFYDTMRNQLEKEKLSANVLDESAMVSATDAVNSLVIEGRFTGFEKGGFIKPGKVTAEFNICRISDHALVRTVTKDLPFPWGASTSDKRMGEYVGRFAAMDVKEALKGVSMPPPGAAPFVTPGTAPAATTTATTAAAVGDAQILFSSDPTGAEINIDGNYAGNTPSQIKVKPGTHSITMTLKGYITWVRSMSLESGDQRIVSATLDKAPQ